jgi:putative acetyltransferase
MTADVTIRDFDPKTDARHFRSLNEAWISRYFTLEPKDRATFDDPVATIIAPGGAILMLDAGGETVGACALVRLDAATYEVAKMAIADSHQSRGLGRKLLEAVIARARSMGARRLYLESNSKLAPALALYRNLGFTDVPRERVPPSPYARVDVWMELFLTPPAGSATGPAGARA